MELNNHTNYKLERVLITFPFHPALGHPKLLALTRNVRSDISVLDGCAIFLVARDFQI